MSIKLGTADLAKYPFLNEASDYIRQTHFDLEEFNRPEMKHIISRAAEMLESEIIRGEVYKRLDKYEIEILTFLVTLIIVRSIGMEVILKKHSLFEAIRAENFLVEDLKKEKNDERKHLLLFKIFNELFKINVDISSDDKRLFKVKISDYLERSSHFHEQQWKLVNRLVHRGYVYLDADETVRLIRNELSNLIYMRIKAMTLTKLPESIEITANEFKNKLPSPKIYMTPRSPDAKDYPPCIKHALEEMDNGINLPHSARLMLATYMLTVGKSVNEIVMLFQNAPDYNERITRYQVEHLAGIRGSHKKYSVPSCQKLRNESLCFAIEECNGITSPIQFGRLRVRKELSYDQQ